MRFDYTTADVASIRAVVETTIAAGERLVDAIESVTGPRTFANTMRPLEDISVLAATAYGQGPFLAQVSTDEEVRSVARDAEETLTKWSLDLNYRDALYAAVNEFAATDEAAALTGEEGRFLDHTLRDFRMAGHELDEADRARVQELRARLVELEIAFATNIADFDDGIVVTRGDLVGLPDDYIERLTPGDEPDTFRVGMAYPDVVPFLDNSPRRDLREALSYKFNNRAREANSPVLSEALQLRAEIARLFGEPSWAHYQMQTKMAKRPEAVDEFYAGLVPGLREGGGKEKGALEKLLAADGHEDELQTWDRRFYHTQQMKTDYGVDPSVVAEYFPLEQVIDGMFSITAEVLGLSYERLPEARAWHPDVTLYEVRNAADGEYIASFYMDLFPREGKFSHAAAFPLVASTVGADGVEQRPVTAIVANFTKPTTGRPSLLQHDEVVTLFHEFGHILHMSLSKAKFARFSSANTEWDFVEAPSQIMENWCWLPDVLGRFAQHYESGEQIPVELVQKLTEARDLNVALQNLRQAYFGQVDMDIHSSLDEVDPEQIEEMRSEMTLLPYHTGTFQLASFGHMLGGYDAGYYGYLWSEVFGDDMFSRFSDEGVLSPEVGMAYRRSILEPNGTKDGSELLEDFLGRPPSNDAFLRKLGIRR
jgi:Zn-dependent oligopeptidase